MTFFNTKKIYDLPNLKDYNDAKKKLLNTKIANYNFFSTEEKWTQLINKFKSSIDQQDSPSSQFLDHLETFKNRRLVDKIYNNHFNLSLSQCLNYYENFFFLYINTDEKYQLKPHEKKSLLNSLMEIGQVCETGINGRLYTALQNHQKEDDWVSNVLVKARCNSIHLLQAEYEAEFGIANTMSAHLYDKLVKLANEKGFGIPILEHIVDIHGGLLNNTQIQQFFNQNFLRHQSAYQRDISSLLIQDVFENLKEIVGTEGQDWQATQAIALPGNSMSKFADFFQTRFRLTNIEVANLIEECGELAEDCASFTLKSQKEIQKTILLTIEKHLHKENYFLNWNELKNTPQWQDKILLPEGVHANEVMTFLSGFEQNNSSMIQKHIHIAHHFKAVLINKVLSDPSSFSLIPRFLRNDTRFIDAMLLDIEQKLLHAITTQQEQDIQDLYDLILKLTSANSYYLAGFHQTIQQHEKFKPLFDNQPQRPLSIKESIAHYQLFYPFLEWNHSKFHAFLNALKKSIPNALEMNELQVKRLACQKEDFNFLNRTYAKKSAIMCLAKNKNIVEAFVEYQLNRYSLERVLSIIIHDLPSYSFQFIKESAKTLFYLFILIKVIPLVSLFIAPFFESLFLSAVLMGMLSWLTQNRYLSSFAYILLYIITLDYELYLSVCCYIFLSIDHSVKNLLLILQSVFEIFNILLGALFSQNILKAHDLSHACANIILRLETLSEASAIQKSDILKELYQHMQEDTSVDWPTRLHKAYHIEFRQKTYMLSFQTVTQMRRTSKDEFSLETHGFGFFKPPTSSSQILNVSKLGI